MSATVCLIRIGMLAAATAWGVTPSRAQDETACGRNGPDVIVGGLNDVIRWGSVDGITAFSVGTSSCNVGDEELLWIADMPLHPVIAQNMYRIRKDRMEQIGMGWLKHGFFALSLDTCDCGCVPTDGTVLGVGCSDPYSAGLNGTQLDFGGTGGLGPRFEVNATTGVYNFPYAFQGVGGDAIFKRLQVHNEDLDPTLNVGATYFVEGHYVTPDDAAAGNKNNNASYRRIVVSEDNGAFVIELTDSTEREKPAIQAWADQDTGVLFEVLDDPEGGRFFLASKCSQNADKTIHYEYALYNMNSHRSARSFRIPIPKGTTITNVGFHDVDYHSGEPYDGTDWSGTIANGAVTWSTDTFASNPNANALRWGTTYNFRFDLDVPMETNVATVGYFRPGTGADQDDVAACTELSSLPNACQPTNSPATPATETHASSSKNRYLSFSGTNAGVNTGFRVTLVASKEFPDAVGAQWWVGEPRMSCENGAQFEPPCSPVGGVPSSTFWNSNLQCQPHCRDWSQIPSGVVYIGDINIVPDAEYEIQAVACGCDITDPAFFSAPLSVPTSKHGDTIISCDTCPCGDAEGAVNVIDCVGVVARFVSADCAPLKSRVDLEPAEPDRQINITDVSRCVEAFQGLPYSFPAPVGCVP